MPVFQKRSLPDEATSSTVRLFQRCRWQADGQSDILEQVEVPLLGAEDHRMDIEAWLQGLGLERYLPAFRENEIDAEVLPELTEADLVTLGLPLGPRRKLLKAIAGLRQAALPSPAPVSATAQEAERRQLTVMFCDLVGSTALSARLDPEDLRAVIGAYHRCCAAVIERAGGFIAKYMGDGVLAYFGYPRADEHDAERAVRAGLALVEAVAGLDTAAAAPLEVRVGITTGLVVVGDLIGQGAAQEQAVVGETPNLAARLQALAAPGTVVIGPSTRRLTAGLFEYADLGAVEIKGLAAPVTATRVLRESGAESRFEALRTARTPLVGRDEELALLQRRWQQAKAGEGCVVLVSGEPGIGKSRLAETLVERLSGEPHTRVRTFCSPHHQDHALYPTITQIERAAGLRREDTADERLNKLEAVLAQAINDLGEAAPLLAALLSLPTGERYPPLSLTPQKQKEKTLQALVAQVQGLAARQPVLMLFEDAHWSDPTSLELYDLIIDRVPALRVLLIITFRPEFSPPWTGRPHVTSLALNRLPPRQRAEMIVGITGGKALPKEIADQIIDRTDGVPLFVEELTKAVVESGMLTDTDDRYTAVGPVTPLAIPASLQASLLARLDRLAPVREVAQIGAALGRQFSHELISAVAIPGSGQVRPGDATAATRRRSGAAGRRRIDLPPRHSARRRIHLQARLGSRRGLQHLTAQLPPAVARPRCQDAGEPLPRSCCRRAGNPGAALHRSWLG
jgi:class 3 adenylate cyclase